MSLSRAFAYSGCPNIVTSLWKANDKTTAFITSRLHHYLGKGFAKDRALQQAKVDLLKSDEISPRLKSPNYWAHLVFIGNYKPSPAASYWIWLAAGFTVLIALVLLLRKRKSPVDSNRT
jgi:CHAT domain